MFFYVKQFRVFHLQGASIFYSAASSVVIKDEKVEMFLQQLIEHSGKIVSKQKILEIIDNLHLDQEKFLIYLEEHLKLLTACHDPSQQIEAILVSSTDHYFEQLLLQELKNILTLPVLSLSDNSASGYIKSPLILSFSDNFCTNQIKKLYTSFQGTLASFITTYVLHRSFIVDGLFVPFKGTPCHFCFFNRWQNLEKNRRKIADASWYNYFQYVTALQENVPLSLPVEQSDIGLLVATLKKKLRWLTTGEVLPTLYDPRVFTRYHLDEGCWDHDVIPHWPGCGCITGGWA